MTDKINVSWFVLSLTIALVGCGCSGPATDVTEYLGKSEQEIKDLLGEPSGPAGRQSQAQVEQMDRQLMQQYYQEKRLVYRAEVSPLPKPLVRLDLIISKEGMCKQVLGQTTGSDTPEGVLAAIGLGDLEREEKYQDRLGVSYKIEPYSIVQVHRPSNLDPKYKDFNVAR